MLTVLSIPQWDPQLNIPGILHLWNFYPSAEFLVHSLSCFLVPSLSGTLSSAILEFLIHVCNFYPSKFSSIACLAYHSVRPSVGPSPQFSWNSWSIAWFVYRSVRPSVGPSPQHFWSFLSTNRIFIHLRNFWSITCIACHSLLPSVGTSAQYSWNS